MTALHHLLKPFVFALPLIASAGASAQEIQFLTEEFPPYNYSKDGVVTGSATAVVRALAASLHQPVSIQVLPWHRALEETATGPHKMLFVGARTADREHRFKWIGPILRTELILLGHKNPGPEMSWADTLSQANILVQTKGPCHERLSDLHALHIETAMDEMANARKFIGGRSPLWCGSPDVLSAMLERTGNRFDDFETKHTVGFTEGYILASKDIADSVIRLWQSALDKMAASGELTAISAAGR